MKYFEYFYHLNLVFRLEMDPTISACAGDVKGIYKVEINNNNHQSQKESHVQNKEEVGFLSI